VEFEVMKTNVDGIKIIPVSGDTFTLGRRQLLTVSGLGGNFFNLT
jgi:hypothetical protein